MKQLFRPGDQKIFQHQVTEADFAAFNGQVVHRVYATFALARDVEWSSRLFVLEAKEVDEEGIGTFLSIEHKSPAFYGEWVTFTAQIETITTQEVVCTVEVTVGDRVIAQCRTGQRVLKLDKLKKLLGQQNK